MKNLKKHLFLLLLVAATGTVFSQEKDKISDQALLYKTGKPALIVDNLYKAFAEGDIPGVLGAMDENIVWNEAEGNSYADGNPYIGPDAVLNGVFGRIGSEHEYFTLNDIALHEMSDNKVLATLRYDAKHKNGNSYNAQAAHLWTLKDGKIIGFQQYVDTKKLYHATGK